MLAMLFHNTPLPFLYFISFYFSQLPDTTFFINGHMDEQGGTE